MTEFVREVKNAGLQQINIRISNKGALNCRVKHGTVYNERLDAFGPDFDPLSVFIRQCHSHGLKACIWMEIFEAGYDEFFIKNPQFTPQGRPGQPNLPGVPSYSHPEVREYFLKRMDEYAAYGPDSIFACIKGTHVPPNLPQAQKTPNGDIGYNPPVVQRYKELYGKDILTEEFDLRQFALINGEFIIDFLAEARQLLNQKGIRLIAGATASGITPCYDNLVLDWKRIADRNAANAICIGNSKHEAAFLYTQKGQEEFQRILATCKLRDIELHAFIFADLGPAKTIGHAEAFSGFLASLPIHIDYCRQLGADAILIHDIEIIHQNPYCERAALRVAGSWAHMSQKTDDGKLTIPLADPAELSFPGHVPQGNFETSPLYYWCAAPSWLTDEHTATGNFSFDFHADQNPEPWNAHLSQNTNLLAQYDSKVMHGAENSGRTYHGRSSLLLGAKPGAGSSSNRTVAWNASLNIPIASQEQWIISVWVHGENLANIADAGMKIDILDSDNHIVDVLTKTCPLDGTFPWQQLCIPHTFDKKAETLKITLYMTVSDTQNTKGMLWFDKFEISLARELPHDTLRIVNDPNSAATTSYALLNAAPGIDMVSVPFRVTTTGESLLRLTMRSQEPMPVTVMLLDQDNDTYNGLWLTKRGDKPSTSWSSTFNITPKWNDFDLRLDRPNITTTAKIAIRPHHPGELHVQEIKLSHTA